MIRFLKCLFTGLIQIGLPLECRPPTENPSASAPGSPPNS